MRKTSFALVLVIFFSLFFNANAFAWWSGTHVAITDNAKDLLSNDSRESKQFYKKYKNYWENLRTGCEDPDYTDEAISGTHFYVCPDQYFENNDQYFKNACNYFLCQDCASADLSARTRFEEHYNKAIDKYVDGNIDAAFLELGRACHYLQDIASTPHSTGIRGRIIRKNVHVDFEGYAECNYYLYNAYSANDVENIYDYVKNNSTGIVLNNLAKLSSKYKSELLSGETSQYDIILADTLPLAQKYTAAVLDKFANEVEPILN